ncbi:MAG TPA: hypothetical protein PK177_07660, partial [Burkholderiaceae bacterium]|nr:hypothetical protein [Burkholderiaceae bacterium]
PMPIAPVAGALLAACEPSFQWTLAGDGVPRRVRLQVASSPDFSDPVVDRSAIDEGALDAGRELAPGNYSWRVAAVDERRGQGPWSDPQTFRRIVAAPGVDAPEQSARGVSLHWRALADALGYRVQVANDPSFASPLIDELVDEQSYFVERPAQGRYYVRVQAMAADGFAGPWSEAQVFEVVSRWAWLWLLLPMILAL